MDIQIQPAIITAITTLTLFICKDIIVASWFSKREDKKKEAEQLRLYIEPLVVSAKKLFFRLDEVFSVEGRGLYLRNDAPASEYNEYKRTTSLYRLAVLLGWKRAFRRELALVKLDVVDAFDKVESALQGFEKALADGSSVEIQRLANIERLWTHIQVPNNRRAEIAVKLEQVLDTLDGLQVLTSNSVVPAGSDLISTVPEALSRFFAAELKIETASSIVQETRARLVNALCIRESWIYRDWQDALGDLMITEIDNSGRRFDVIGYQKFLELCRIGSSSDKELLRKLERLFQDIDIANDSDSRVQVLWSTYRSCAYLIRDVAAAFPGTNLLADTDTTIKNSIDLNSRFTYKIPPSAP